MGCWFSKSSRPGGDGTTAAANNNLHVGKPATCAHEHAHASGVVVRQLQERVQWLERENETLRQELAAYQDVPSSAGSNMGGAPENGKRRASDNIDKTTQTSRHLEDTHEERRLPTTTTSIAVSTVSDEPPPATSELKKQSSLGYGVGGASHDLASALRVVADDLRNAAAIATTSVPETIRKGGDDDDDDDDDDGAQPEDIKPIFTVSTAASKDVVETVGSKVQRRLQALSSRTSGECTTETDQGDEDVEMVKNVVKSRKSAAAMKEQRRSIAERINRHQSVLRASGQ
ncbi:hypothetical protein NFJ02_25g57130 [Pycnococcus provasolii]